jgi:hypothetical protein
MIAAIEVLEFHGKIAEIPIQQHSLMPGPCGGWKPKPF